LRKGSGAEEEEEEEEEEERTEEEGAAVPMAVGRMLLSVTRRDGRPALVAVSSKGA
jgi:hypothetical protein